MRTTRAAAAVLIGLLLAVLPAAGPARAHTGKLELEVAGDGATGVTVQARYADGHLLDKPLRLTLTATGAGSRAVGPVQLAPAGEGQGFYSSGPVLAVGKWKVTVRAPAPHTAKVTVEIRAEAARSGPPPATPGKAAEPAAPGPSWPWWPAGLAALLGAGVVGLAVSRRRDRS